MSSAEQSAGEQNAHEAAFDRVLQFVLNETDGWNEHEHEQEGAPPAAHAAPDEFRASLLGDADVRLRLRANWVHEAVQWKLMRVRTRN